MIEILLNILFCIIILLEIYAFYHTFKKNSLKFLSILLSIFILIIIISLFIFESKIVFYFFSPFYFFYFIFQLYYELSLKKFSWFVYFIAIGNLIAIIIIQFLIFYTVILPSLRWKWKILVTMHDQLMLPYGRTSL